MDNDKLQERNEKIAKMNPMELKAALYDNQKRNEDLSKRYSEERTEIAGERNELLVALG